MTTGPVGDDKTIHPAALGAAPAAAPPSVLEHPALQARSTVTLDALSRTPGAVPTQALARAIAKAKVHGTNARHLGSAVRQRRRAQHGGHAGTGRTNKHRQAKRASAAGRLARGQTVRSNRAGGSGRGVSSKDFGGLTAKLSQMGISKADVTALSQKYKVPPAMIMGVIMQESRGNPNATSPVGAKGLMQLMPATAHGLGVTNPSDPKQNLEGGVKYLGQMLHKFNGNQQMALAAYNAGPGRVQRAQGVPAIKETQNYVHIISGNQAAAQAAFNAWN